MTSRRYYGRCRGDLFSESWMPFLTPRDSTGIGTASLQPQSTKAWRSHCPLPLCSMYKARRLITIPCVTADPQTGLCRPRVCMRSRHARECQAGGRENILSHFASLVLADPPHFRRVHPPPCVSHARAGKCVTRYTASDLTDGERKGLRGAVLLHAR